MHIRPYQKLVVWQEAHTLCLLIYRLTKNFPTCERFRLVDQMCRSSSSISTNIAEGSVMNTKKHRFHFYSIASASLEELHYQCLLSKDIQYISDSEFIALDKQIQRTSFLLMKIKESLH